MFFYPGGAHDIAGGVIATSDGGYLINGAFGKSNAPGVFSAGYIIKTDSLGNQQWVQTLTGQSFGDNYGSIAVENSNGEFICYGHVQYHPGCSSYATRITKLSSNGNIVWSYCLQINPDWTGGIDKLAGVDNYVSVFNDQTNGTIFLRKWDDNGQQSAITSYKFNNAFSTTGSISTAKNAGFFIFGNYDTTGGKKNAYIAYFDNSMNLLWEKSYSKSTTSTFQRVTQDSASNIYCTGGIYASNQIFDLLAVKFDPNGNLIGSGRFGTNPDADLGNGIALLDNGDIVCSGSTGTTALIVKFCGLGCGNGQSQAYYSDADGDGYGDVLLGYYCQAVPNSSLLDGDCNDTDPNINPDASEICNGIDDNCDGATDEGLAPLVAPIAGQSVQCISLGFGATTFSVPPVNGALNYNWILPPDVSVLNGQGTNTLTIYWNLPQAHDGITGPLRLVVTNNCGQTEVSVDLHLQISVPVRPSSISGPSKLCPGEQATFSVLSVARCRLYNWTLPTGMTLLSGAGTNIITVGIDASYTGGAISLTANNACGTSPSRTKNLFLNNPVIAGVVTGPSSGLCEQSGIAYILSSVPGATSYQWTVPQGASIVSGQGSNSITVDFGPSFTSGALYVIANNNCGYSSARTLSLQAAPSKPGVITGLQQICPGQVQVPYSIQTVSNTNTYNWSLLAGLGNIASGQGTKNITINYNYVNTTGQQMSVTASNNCGTSIASVLNGIIIQPSNCNRNEISQQLEGFYLYPNPSTSILFLGGNTKDPVLYKIFDMTGQIVASGNTSMEINISGLAAGMYLCEIRDAQGNILLLDRMEVQR
ncbi:MAG: T9SS type A sorting domain-containing protein [Bacteroidetes bacterium]|nr:T9SS type A sorting domain-containing protein [Bacteroidota bacterium]